MNCPRVLLADDHQIIIDGLCSLLRDQVQLVGTVRDGRALLDAARELHPDLVITDISMPLLNGLDAVKQLRKQPLPPRRIVLTMHPDTHLAAEAFRAGAAGYLLKHSAGDELIQAIQEVMAGRAYLTPLIARDLIALLIEARNEPRGEGERITPRQREVLQLVMEGKTMKEVAHILKISTRTAETHKYDMMSQLGIETTAGLIQYGIKIGIVSLSAG